MFRLVNNITAAGPSTMAVVLKRFASSVPKPIVNPPIKYTEVITQEIVVHVESHISFYFVRTTVLIARLGRRERRFGFIMCICKKSGVLP